MLLETFLKVWSGLFRRSRGCLLLKVLETESADVYSRLYRESAPPMQVVIAGWAAYMSEQPDSIPAYAGRNLYHNDMAQVDESIIRTVASFQVCVGLAGAHRAGVPFTPVDVSRSFLYNTLLMLGKIDKRTGKPDPKTVSHLQCLWTLGADLGFTNSTAALLHGASPLGDPVSCFISALSSGYGILHFSAAEASLKSLAATGRKENVPHVIAEVKRREARLFGYGHRMFKTRDPRISLGMQIVNKIDLKHPLLKVANEVDRIARSDEYFVSRKLEANGDLFLGVGYAAL